MSKRFVSPGAEIKLPWFSSWLQGAETFLPFRVKGGGVSCERVWAVKIFLDLLKVILYFPTIITIILG